MRVIKHLDLNGDEAELWGMFETQLLSNASRHSPAYRNKVNEFQAELKKLAQRCFEKGQANAD